MSLSYTVKRFLGLSRPSRIAYIDLAKCIATFLIIFAHTDITSYNLVYFSDSMRLFTFWICAGYTSRPDVIISRKTKLLVNYVVMTLVCVACSLWLFKIHVTSTDIFGLFYARFKMLSSPISAENPVLMPLCNSVLWFLPSFFVSYCFFKIIMKFRFWKGQALACLVSIVIATLLNLQPYLLPWGVDGAFLFAVYMCFGQWMRRYSFIESAGVKTLLICILVYAGVFILNGSTNMSTREYGSCWPLIVVGATAGVAALLILCRYLGNTWIGRLAMIFNSEALYIYGLQLVFLRISQLYIAPFLHSGVLTLITEMTLCFVGGYVVGKLFALVKTGFIRLFAAR